MKAPTLPVAADHSAGWVAGDGPTDIDKLTLACPPDNRLIEEAGWTTRKRQDGRIEWIPPPGLDTGQTRVNDYHHPQRDLVPDENDESEESEESDESGESDESEKDDGATSDDAA